jgi:hypothetical protein
MDQQTVNEEVKDRVRDSLIEKAKKLLKVAKAKVPDFDKMDNGDLIAFIRSLNAYIDKMR